jgi:hypothetical protein
MSDRMKSPVKHKLGHVGRAANRLVARGTCASLLATVAAVLVNLMIVPIHDVEEIGSVVLLSLIVIPSVVSYLLLDSFRSTRNYASTGFAAALIPAAIVTTQMWHLGSTKTATIFLVITAAAACGAFAFLVWTRH